MVDRPHQVAGGPGCPRCHATGRWRPLPNRDVYMCILCGFEVPEEDVENAIAAWAAGPQDDLEDW